jgi:hexosaminidase
MTTGRVGAGVAASRAMRDLSPDLFPLPREIAFTGDPPPRDAAPRFARDASLPAQGYAIRADRDGVRVAHADDAGRRHAEDTLAQLARAHGGALPGVALRDWPDFPVRGFLLDVSRDRVPTRDSLAHLVARLARLRFNHFELYTEHTFAYPGHEAVWRDASPITPDDVRWLDRLCADHGIELCANQNTFGHMERWLEHAEYRERAEAPDGWETPGGGRRPPSVLAPTPENAAFALALVRELARHFTSRRVNLNGDEPFELGTGRSRDAVAARGRGRVYLEHLLRLIDGVRADGREALFWGDILHHHPELVGELPRRDAIALLWHYEAPDPPLPEIVRANLAPYGISAQMLRGFAGQVDAFAENAMPFWVCPGTSSWNSLVGRLGNARANLRDAAEIGLARGATGFLLTDWGDNGHLQPPSVSFAPMLDAAGLAWNAARHRDLDLAARLDALVFEDEARVLGAACTAMGELGAQTGLVGFNASPLHAALLGSRMLLAMGKPDPRAASAVAESIDALFGSLSRARPRCADGAIAVRELAQALRLAQLGAWRLARHAGAQTPDEAMLRARLAAAIEEQRACWLARARPGGLADSVARLESALGERAA